MTDKQTTMSAEYWKEQAQKEMRAKVDAQIRLFFRPLLARQASSLKAREASSRPKKKNQLRALIIKAMKKERRSQESFKSFMQMWEMNHLEGLTLSYLNGKKYLVKDENADAGEKQYTWGSLEKMYSEAN